jgi:hypothetical protein
MKNKIGVFENEALRRISGLERRSNRRIENITS